jgi:hypothetical protein
MRKNNLNVKFIITMLLRIVEAVKSQEPCLIGCEVPPYGVSDDHIYCEFLHPFFEDLHPLERKAVMRIVRNVITETAMVYDELLDEGYLGYENFDNSLMEDFEGENLDDFIESLRYTD